jgi:hypothetical protein
MKENTEIWESLRQVPREALKRINGGRLNGKTDINPQWRYQRMTEIFGICGIGWGYEVTRKWTKKNEETKEVAAFVDINLWVKVDGEKSEPIQANGGSMLIAKESKGLYLSDEAYKMATTDALGTAMKMLGLAADVYLGKTNHDNAVSGFNDSKYSTESAPTRPQESKSLVTPEMMNKVNLIIDLNALKKSFDELTDEQKQNKQVRDLFNKRNLELKKK